MILKVVLHGKFANCMMLSAAEYNLSQSQNTLG